MEKGQENFLKAISGFLCFVYVTTLYLAVTCLDAKTFSLSCLAYGASAIGSLVIGSFVSIVGLFADNRSRGKAAVYFWTILAINLGGVIFFLIHLFQE